MTDPPFLAELLGMRKHTESPNIADSDSSASVSIARGILEDLGLLQCEDAPEGQSAGTKMEMLVAADLRERLASLSPEREWSVQRPGLRVSRFAQYAHLATLQRLIETDRTGVLATAIGREYEVSPDVTIGLRPQIPDDERLFAPDGLPYLHASVSCKLTIRSDRVQNIRQESAILTRQRRGRLPHIVAVTLEPLPSRIAAIARGTGDVDAVYHPALGSLTRAVRSLGNRNQTDTLEELLAQRRLIDYAELAVTLAVV